MVSVHLPSSLQLQPDLRCHPGVIEGVVVLPVEAGLGKEIPVDLLQGQADQAGKRKRLISIVQMWRLESSILSRAN